jgi:HD-GYP domain-containing protein (c-di-GMP phosphodiesterase class II)
VTPPDATSAFLRAVYHALREVRTRGAVAVEKPAILDRLRAACDPALDEERRLELRIVRRALYVNGRLIERDVENFVYHAHVLDVLAGAGVGTLVLDGLPSRRDLRILLPLLVRLSDPDVDRDRLDRLRRALSERGVRSVQLKPPSPDERLDEAGRRAIARETYARSVRASRELFDGTRVGSAPDAEGIKRTVESIVDGVLTNEESLGGLSALRDFDDYAFTHAVNTCILCVAIGRRIGLSKGQLYELGHAALVHDIGMSLVPREILTRGSALTAEERAEVETHTWRGALRIFDLRDFGEVPLRSMVVAYEHHLGRESRGYPEVVRPRTPSIFARIISVVSSFDAATNERAYSPARPAEVVLREFRKNDAAGLDPVVVKALSNLLGVYPTGTCVVLTSSELAVVHSPNPDPTFADRPVVRLLCDPDGRWLHAPPLADLADTDEHGRNLRSIARTVDPARYGIRVSDVLT